MFQNCTPLFSDMKLREGGGVGGGAGIFDHGTTLVSFGRKVGEITEVVRTKKKGCSHAMFNIMY